MNRVYLHAGPFVVRSEQLMLNTFRPDGADQDSGFVLRWQPMLTAERVPVDLLHVLEMVI